MVLNRKITPYIYILFFSFFFNKIYSQKTNEFKLEIKSNILTENDVIKNINYKKIFTKRKILQQTKDSVLNTLKEKGYFSLLIEKFNQNKNTYTYFLRLGKKIKAIYIKIKPSDIKTIEALNLKIDENYLILKTNTLKKTLNLISNYLVKNGQLFSVVKLRNHTIKNQTLFTELEINQTEKRSIDKTIIKDYEDFPISFLNQYLNLNKTKTISINNIEEISKRINQLSFVSEIKRPELLFSKDSTLLYLYLKKKQANSFDGLINFSSENNKIKFRGYLDLSLINIFNKGEKFVINWKSNSNKTQDFTLIASLPYLFKSKISSEISFNLFRNDSIYTNTNSEISLKYPINKFINLSIIYSSESSSTNSNSNNISNFNKSMIGLGLQNNSEKENQFELSIFYGKRNTNAKTNQYLINSKFSRLIHLSKRIAFYINNKSSFLFSDSYLENELFREGGPNSIRGFNEQSIFTSKFSYINSETRLLSKNKSFLYSIQDLGIFSYNKKNNILFALGLGYQLNRKNNSINISYSQGNFNKRSTTLSSGILSIKMLTSF